MKKILKQLQHNLPLFIGVVAVIAGGIGFFGVQALTGPKSSVSPVKTSCDVTCVDLYSDKASPDTLTITVGSTVQFNSKDSKPHALYIGKTEDGHAHSAHAGDENFSSGVFEGDEAWRVQFKDQGSYIFKDEKNPKVEILVVVYTPGKDYTKIQ